MSDENELNPVVDFIAHHWWSFWGGVIAVNTVGTFYDGWISFFVVLAGVLTWSHISARSRRIHEKNLCLRCIRDIPDDPQDEVDKHKSALKLVHRVVSTSRIVLVGLPLWLAWSMGMGYLQVLLGFGDSFREFLSPLVIFSPLLFLDRATNIHNRLQPWCPYCWRRRGGGKDVPEVTPTPDPAGSKTV